MIMNHRALIPVLLLACAFTATAADDSVKIDNDTTRVLVVDSLPGAKSKMHEHKINRVTVYLDPGKMTLTDSDGKVETLTFKANEALWSPATTRPHISENVSGHTVRIVEIELKSPAPTTPRKNTGDLDWVK